MRLSDFVYPDINAARSVNLQRDRGHLSTLEQYQITNKAREVINRFIAAINGERVSAWSLTGPYGMGKSSFANYLVAITGNRASPETKLAYKKLRDIDSVLCRKLDIAVKKSNNQNGFFRVPITAAYEPINHSIISGLLRALTNGQLTPHEKNRLKKLTAQLENLSRRSRLDSKDVVASISLLREKLNRTVIIIIDEFGKNLEYMAHHPDEGDIFIMQVLAETSNFYLWVCLHQAFERYAAGLTAQHRQEWSKIQGRFEDISFVESTSEMLSLVKRVLVQKANNSITTSIRNWASKIAKEVKHDKLSIISGMSQDEMVSLYPLHPVTAIILPELCRRFAQNDRTLFSFLCSGDPYALPQYLHSHETEKYLPAVGLDYLYDYFFSVSTSTFVNRPEAQRWIEIQDIIGQAHSLSPLSQAILKTIGILNLISGPHGIPATLSILRLALQETVHIDSNALEQEIMNLSNKKILIYRQYAKEYRLWEGSDFDVIGAIYNKKATIATRPLDETLQHYCPQTILIAARHSYETGTVRRFECRWMALEDLKKIVPTPVKGYDGLFVYAFGRQMKIQGLPSCCSDGRPLLVAYTSHENQIKELVLETAASRSVLDEAPELLHDGVARKEARFRVRASEDQLRDYVERIYNPSSKDVEWHANGMRRDVRTYSDLTRLISQLCDQTYDKCPIIGNEMINYDKLSSAAARARRELAEAMVIKEREPQLGLKGFGPEVAVYRALFRSQDLHHEKEGIWAFVRPDPKKHSKLALVWNLLDTLINKAQNGKEGISFRVLIYKLKEPPFGMREGPIPLLLCHYLIVNADEIALYQEGEYKPYFGEAEIGLLIKRPDLFSLKRFVSTGIRRDVIQAYLQVLNTEVIQFKDKVRNISLLQIVTPLLQFARGLPQYTCSTRKISPSAQKLCRVILNSREPIQLLFKEIPEALDIEPLEEHTNISDKWKNTLRERLQASLLELYSAFERLRIDIQSIILEAFHYKCETNNIKSFRMQLQNIVSPLVRYCRDDDLKPVLIALANDSSSETDWIQSIAGQVSKKPIDTWHDSDIDPFRAAIRDIADRIESLIELLAASNRLDGNNAIVLALTEKNGKTHRQVLQIDDQIRDKIQKLFPELFDQPRDLRSALCALLAESLKKTE